MMLRKNRITPAFPPPFHDFLADLEALGTQRTASGGDRYSVVAARSNLRWWLIPSDQGTACARAGYEMLQPMSRTSQLAKWGLQTLESLRLLGWFRGDEIRLTGTPGFLSSFGETELCCSYLRCYEVTYVKSA